MRRVVSLLALASLIVQPLASIAAPKSATPKVVGVDIQRRTPSDIIRHDRNRLRKRSGTTELTLDNEETLYFTNISLGTPAQALKLHIDTGSSDLWVNTANSSLCSRRNQCSGGTYDPTSSSTLATVNSDFNITYADGTGATGDYVTDTIVVGDITLDNFQFGLGEVSTSTEGILGIGYTTNEVQVQRAGLNAYPNFPQALKNAGYIARNAYSLWLNDQESSTGTILFGGVNTAKYQGTLATLPVIPTYGVYSQLMIALTGVSIGGSGISSSNLPVAALLDSGTTLTYLPSDITAAIYNQVGATYNQQEGYGYIDCSLANSDGTIEFSFSGKTISVAYEELVIEESGSSCMFGIAPNDGISVLGDTFLRSAYVVYDLDNNEISLAQTVFNATDDSVEEIPSGTSTPPGATAVANAVTSVNGASGGSSALDAQSSGTTSTDSMLRLPLTTFMAGLTAVALLFVL